MDIKSNSGNNKNSLDSEKSLYERLEIELKNVIFAVLFQLLKDDEPSIYFSFIISIIQFLQALYFPFHRNLKSAWNSDTIANGIENILGYFQLVTYLKQTTWQSYVIMFYVGVAVIGLMILDFFFVSYSVSRKKNAFSWPVYALRSVLSLTITILFMPLLDYFLSMLQCVDSNDPILISNGQTITNQNSVSVHIFFNQIQCWKDVHILHASIAIIISLFFILLSLIVVLVYFECRQYSNDPTARTSARPNFVFMLYQVVMMICFTFMVGKEFHYLLIALLLAGSLIVFAKFHYSSPYFNETMRRLWSSIAAINVWTMILLCFAIFLERKLFEGTIIAWIIGIPIIVLIVVNNKKQNIDILLVNVNKFESGDQLISQARYLQQLIAWAPTSKTASILLDGYLEVHRQTCNKDDCASKVKKISSNRIAQNLIGGGGGGQAAGNKQQQQQQQQANGAAMGGNNTQGNEESTESEKITILQSVLYQMFFYGIKKFPNNTNLRLAYSFYLLEYKKYKQQSLQELTMAEQNHPPFDIDFIIYRYKKIIEDEIAESQNDGNLDIVSEMAFQNHMRLMQNNIERSALMHMEFWSQLSEDNPDLGKLNEIGVKINFSVQQVEEQWNRLKKMSSNMPKATRLYGKYIIEVINDKATGEELLERARAIQNANNNNRKLQIYTSNEDISNESYPTLIITSEQDKFGHIIAMNLSASNLFGYSKSELINRKINLLMPSIHAKFHDSFLENYIQTNDAKFMNKERLVFGKTKSNYIFPCYLTIRTMQSLTQGLQFIGSFRIEKNFRKVCYVYTDTEGNIEHLSSSSNNLLKIDNKYVTQKKINIEDLLADILGEKQKYMTKTGCTVEYSPPKDVDSAEGECPSEMNLIISEINFSHVELAGYIFKFEKMQDVSITQNISKQGKPRIGISSFQFTYAPTKSTYYGQFFDQPCSELISQRIDDSVLGGGLPEDSMQKNERINETGLAVVPENERSNANIIQLHIRNSPNPAGSRLSAQENGDQQDGKEQKKNYGDGIKTMRYQDGHLVEIEEQGTDEDEEEEEKQQRSLFQSNRNDDELDDGSLNDFSTIFKSRKALNAVVTDQSEPISILNQKRVANCLILILIALSFVDYFLAIRQFENIQQNIDMIVLSNQRIAELESILGNIRELKLLNYGLYDKQANATANLYNQLDPDQKALMETTLKNEIKSQIIQIQELQKNLTFSSMEITSAHHALLQEESINMIFSENQPPHMYDLNDATQQIINYAFQIVNLPLTSITDNESNVNFVELNMFSDYYNALRQSSDYYVQELDGRTESSTDIVSVIVSAVSLILAILILIPVLMVVNSTREEVLGLFLDIPEKTVKYLYSKCENFISNIQIGEEDEVASLDDLDKQAGGEGGQDDIEEQYRQRRRRKKFKNSTMSQRQFFISLIIGSLVIEAYFIFNFFMSQQLLHNTYQIMPEINTTTLAEPFYVFVDNAQRKLFLDNNSLIFGRKSFDVTAENIRLLYILDSQIHQEHSLNVDIHYQSYLDAFNQIMMLDPCNILFEVKAANINDCQTFAEGSVYQGMAVALTRYFENLRYLNTIFQKFQEDPGANFTDKAPINTPYKEINANKGVGYNKIASLLISPPALELREMQKKYIKGAYRYLVQELQSSINQQFRDSMTQRLALFVVFDVLLFIIYFIFWLPMVAKLTKSIWRTRSMLTMIPINVISHIKSVRVFIRKYLTEHSVSNY